MHDGFDNDHRRLFFKDLLNPSTFHEVLSLAYRRVVREFHAGPPCLTFGTLRRPRLRSKTQPAGFNPSDILTSEHNILARRTAMIGCVAVLDWSLLQLRADRVLCHVSVCTAFAS